MRGQFLPLADLGVTHTHSSQLDPPILVASLLSSCPYSAAEQLPGKTPEKLANLTMPFFAQVDLVFATHFALDCACGAP